MRAQRDCPNGQLTRDKFLEVYSSFFPQGNADKFCEHVFRTFDSDNSGKIDFKEFLQAINITSSGKPEQKLEWAFNMYDVNGDGTIEPSEMSEIIGVRASYSHIPSGLRTAPFFVNCDMFVYSQPIFIIFWHIYTIGKLQLGDA